MYNEQTIIKRSVGIGGGEFMFRRLLIVALLIFFITFTCYGMDDIDEFLEGLSEAQRLFDEKEYHSAIYLLEKHSEILHFNDALFSEIERQIIQERNILGDCYIRIGNLRKAIDVFGETNGATDYSDSYALYQTALFTLLFDDTRPRNVTFLGMATQKRKCLNAGGCRYGQNTYGNCPWRGSLSAGLGGTIL